MKLSKVLKLFMKGSINDDDLYKLLGSTLINLVYDATTLTKHGDDDTSFDDCNPHISQQVHGLYALGW